MALTNPQCPPPPRKNIFGITKFDDKEKAGSIIKQLIFFAFCLIWKYSVNLTGGT
jgi:hypothetical protein